MADPVSSTPTYIKAREALCIYGELSYHLIFPYICVELSLSEQLEHLSAAIHLILALYVLNDAQSHFIPNPLFVDIGMMVKNTFFCVAKVKVDHPKQPFFLVLLGTDQLESLFGILHTMVGNDTNLDILQLALRITLTTEVSTILAKHPEWDRSLHRLCLPSVSRNLDDVSTFSTSLDHIGPRAYQHPDKLHPSSLTLATSWKCGRHSLEAKYLWIMPILQTISSTENASILALYGINLVVRSLKGGTNDAGQEEDTPSRKPDSPRCKSEVLDATSGMQELEDTVAESEGHWRNSETSRQETVSHTVQIGGITTKKSRALAQQFRYVTSASSTDQLRCVAQEGRFKTTGSVRFPHSQAGDAHIDRNRPTLSIHQPITTVIGCEGELFLCMAEVNGLFLDHQPVDEIPISVLSEKVSQVSYQGLRLVSSTYSDVPDGKHDWRSQDLFRLSATVPGTLVLPINPDVASHKLCDAFFLFHSSDLMAIATNLQDSICHSHRKAIPLFKPSDHFPYREQDGKFSCY